jgi:hypothetical protein
MTTATSRHPSRINARLDDRHSAKLEYLKRTTGLGVSDIVKRGIDLVYEDVQKETRDPFEVLSEVGFIGSAEGPSDLSERYKDELRELLPPRPPVWPAAPLPATSSVRRGVRVLGLPTTSG